MKTISPRIKSLIDCDRVLHNWARLLARVGEICVPAKPDHSHMSFTWNPEIRGLVGQSFISNKGHVSLALSIREPICFYFMGSKENQRLIEIDIAGNHYAIVMDFLDLALRDLGYRKANVSRKVSFKFPDQFKSDGTSPPISNEILQLW